MCAKGVTMTLSFGAPVSSWRSIQEGILAAVQAGIFVVAAAGNDNIDVKGITPASSPFVCSVGASDVNDAKASFSNYGAMIGVFAPGVAIQSAWIGGVDASVSSVLPSPHIPIPSNERSISHLELPSFCELAGQIALPSTKIPSSPLSQPSKPTTSQHPNQHTPNPHPHQQQSLSGTSMSAPHIAALAATIMSSKGPQNPLTLCTTIKNTAITNALSGVPSGTPNRLVYNGVG